MYKIKTFASRGVLCQIDRIEDGFRLLGHEIVNDGEVNFIYCNDQSTHKQAIEYKRLYPKSKLILNTLDLPFHLPDYRFIIDDLTLNLMQADAVTTISETVKNQMLSAFPFLQKNGITTIFQPIKAIKPLKLERNGKTAVFGRQSDINKGFLTALRGTIMADTTISIIGSENPINSIKPEYKNYCEYKGLVDDKKLNIEYNSCSCVLICSEVEGLCLPLIEGLVSKTPVVCLSRMQTAKEFCPPQFICDGNEFTIGDKIKSLISAYNNKEEWIFKILDEYSERYLKQFSPESVAYNIVKVFQKLVN